MMKSICVFLGSHMGNNPLFHEAVVQLAQEIVIKNLTLTYGGSSMGLMGLLAQTVKKQGGTVVGVMTQQLIEKEIPPNYLDALHIVSSMQERKQHLQQKADLFLVMPGGLGTLEEAFETWNAIKIRLFNKPIGFLNIDHYFDDMFSFIKVCQQHGFISENHATIPSVHSDVRVLLNQLIK